MCRRTLIQSLLCSVGTVGAQFNTRIRSPILRQLVWVILPILPGAAQAITVPAGNAETTLWHFAAEATLLRAHLSMSWGQVLLSPRTYQTHAVDTNDLVQGLHQLLDGTGLTFEFGSATEVNVVPETYPTPPPPPFPRRVSTSRRREPALLPTRVITSSAGECICAQTYTEKQWIDGPWCKYEDGRKRKVPNRCPLPNPYASDSGKID